MSLWSSKPFISARVLGRSGHYPAFEVATQGHLFVAAEDLVWTAVVQRPLPEDWEIGEFTPLIPEEVRLLSAITLCEPNTWDHGLPIMTHCADFKLDPEAVGFDLRSPATRSPIHERVLQFGPDSRPGLWESQAPGYSVSNRLGSKEDALHLLASINTSDQLQLAGLARLLGANRLLTLNEPEEAAIALFISMGAALEYIRLALAEQKGVVDVPFADVLEYFRQTFPQGEEIAEYFEAQHEERVIAVHPANRFGEFWAPPLMMDDVYDLRKTMIELYRHILLGEVNEANANGDR